ncbi:hypothetical protein ZWY2020_035881 [Hordeum vulgare]|nr:hypothetical protein ZWY2020_035881 [Hordeum vulgare]
MALSLERLDNHESFYRQVRRRSRYPPVIQYFSSFIQVFVKASYAIIFALVVTILLPPLPWFNSTTCSTLGEVRSQV